jgi:acetolactate synthase-1/2/3 large subunit
MRVADAIFGQLKQETDTVYMVAGGGAMFLIDALGRSGMRYVPAIFEQGAGLMAIGHAMAGGGLGVCLTTSGPGATNAVTACLAAWMDSIPVLFLNGQARSDTLAPPEMRTMGIQEIGILPIVASITKYAAEPMTPAETLAALHIAMHQCTSGRPGPCWLSIPQDIQGMEIQ